MADDAPRPIGGKRRRRAPAKRCPICGAPVRHETRPFCSRRCADVDLDRWLGGAYRVPTGEAPSDPADADNRDNENRH